MAAIHNYYRILGIKTTAGIQEINQAIAALRQKDAAGNYSATINTIAATLSEPQKRAAYDDELGLDAALRGDYDLDRFPLFTSTTCNASVCSMIR